VPSALYVVPPLLLIAVLVVSAVAKLLDPRDTSSVFRQLGLPHLLLRLRAPRLLPYGELGLAALLALAPGRWYVVAASATLLLFALYLGVIMRALRLPYPVTCPCFGRLGLGEVTRRTLARNGVLVVLALVTWGDSWRGHGVWQRLGDLDGWAWWLALPLATVVPVVVLVALRSGLRRPPSEETDTDPLAYRPVPTPNAVLHGPTGAIPVWRLSDSAARLLVFCEPGRDDDVIEQSRSWATRLAPVRVHVVDETGRTGDREGEGGSTDAVLHDPGGVLRRALGVASPGAVLLGTDRMLAGGPADGVEEMSRLVDAVAEELEATDAAAP
jgi:hypothetical protein